MVVDANVAYFICHLLEIIDGAVTQSPSPPAPLPLAGEGSLGRRNTEKAALMPSVINSINGGSAGNTMAGEACFHSFQILF